MNGRADAFQVRRWQEEVARDPGNPAFLPLADVYRREGRLEVARRLCERGLERNPDLVDAHYLLGRVYRELGEFDKAFDEWDIALHLEPQHGATQLALGHLCLQRRDWAAAAAHFAAAEAAGVEDPRLPGALAVAQRNAAAETRPPPEPERSPAEVLAEPLSRFVRESRVRLALLLDPSGRVLAQHGFTPALDIAAFASLGASIHLASRTLARALGQAEFEQLYQGSSERQLFLAPVSAAHRELILLAVFGGETTIGLVRVLFAAFAAELATVSWRTAPTPRASDAPAFEAELAAGLAHVAGPAWPNPLRP